MIEPFSLVGGRSAILTKEQASRIVRNNSYYFLGTALLTGIGAVVLRFTDGGMYLFRTLLVACVYNAFLAVSIWGYKSRLFAVIALVGTSSNVIWRSIHHDVGGLFVLSLLYVAVSYRCVRATFVYHKMQTKPPSAEPVMAALKDKDPEVRRVAAQELSRSSDAGAFEPLLTALKDDNYEVRIDAAKALFSLNDSRSVEPFIDALKDKNADMRRIASEGLATLHDKRAVGPLISLLEEDYDPNIRAAVSKALKNITNQDFGKEAAKWHEWWEKNNDTST